MPAYPFTKPSLRETVVRGTGIEPVWCEPHAPQTCASASSATLASYRSATSSSRQSTTNRLYTISRSLSRGFPEIFLIGGIKFPFPVPDPRPRLRGCQRSTDIACGGRRVPNDGIFHALLCFLHRARRILPIEPSVFPCGAWRPDGSLRLFMPQKERYGHTMRRNRKRGSLLAAGLLTTGAAALTATLLLASCGGGNGTETDSSAGKPATVTVAPSTTHAPATHTPTEPATLPATTPDPGAATTAPATGAPATAKPNNGNATSGPTTGRRR